MRNRLKLLVLGVGTVLALCGALGNSSADIANSFAAKASYERNDSNQFIGYGYNVTSGKSISDTDALSLNNPILKMDENLYKHVQTFNTAQTTYQSYSSSKASEVAANYGVQLSGGVSGKIAAISCEIGTKFNVNTTFAKSSTQYEEYSYYSIYALHQPVILQMNINEIRNSLSDEFKKDLYAAKSNTSAAKLYSKYGTHLLTGYTLGGIFEMTNYYATCSSSYVREISSSFSAQVSATMSYASVSADSNFGVNYSSKDNNAYAVNNYKCSTYGGATFPGLTIEQAFSWYETLTSAGYIYDTWTKSVNNGENLVIVDIPQSSEMIGLWDLLPSDKEYDSIRSNLFDEYIKECGNVYKTYRSKYKDIQAENAGISGGAQESDDYKIYINGYDSYLPSANKNDSTHSQSNVAYVKYDSDTLQYIVKPDTIVALDYDTTDLIGKRLKWETNNSEAVEVIDEVNGIFRFKESTATATLTAHPFGSTYESASIKFKVSNKFAGGSGKENDPYLISSISDMNDFFTQGNSTSKEYYKLIADLDYASLSLEGNHINYQNNFITSFSGEFDGNYHTIKNFYLSPVYTVNEFGEEKYGKASSGLFGNIQSSGCVKNLTLKNVKLHSFGEDSYTDSSLFDWTGTKSVKMGLLSSSSSGSIENCNIINGMMITKFEEITTATASSLYIGLFTGENDGTIKNCIVTSTGTTEGYIPSSAYSLYPQNIDVSCIVASPTSKPKGFSGIGGICGYLYYGDVSSCMVENSCLWLSSPSSTSVAHSLCTGGIVGESLGGSIKFCVVRNFNNSASNAPLIHASGNSSASSYAYAGGLVGAFRCDARTTVLGSVVYDIGAAKIIVGGNNSSSGLFTGKFEKDGDSFYEKYFQRISSCYVVPSGASSDTLFDSLSVSGAKSSYNYTDMIKIDTSASYQGLPEKIKSDEDSMINSNSQGEPIVINKNISDINFDFRDAITDFAKGDSFKTGTYKINIVTNDGEEIEVNDYRIEIEDSSGVVIGRTDSGISTSLTLDYIGTFRVNVYSFGRVDNYTIKVENSPEYELIIKDSNEGTYYAGEKITKEIVTSELEIAMSHENGQLDDIDLSNCSFYYDDHFSVGSNPVTVKYKTFSSTFYIDAIDAEVVSIELEHADEKPQYSVGSTNVDLSYIDNVVVNIKESDAINGRTTFDVTYEELDLLSTRIYEGTNNVKVSYGDYITSSFVVEGIYTDNSETIANYSAAVAEVATVFANANSSLLQKYTSLHNALVYKEKLVECSETEWIQVNAITQELQQYLDAYNEIAYTINEDFVKAIEIANNFNYTVVLSNGFLLLTVILFIIKKGFLF